MTKIVLLFILIESYIYTHSFIYLLISSCIHILLAITVRSFLVVMEGKEEVNIWHKIYNKQCTCIAPY